NENSQTLTITAVSNAIGGTVSIVGSDVIFTPAAHYSGAASFVYTLQDDGTTNGVSDFKTSTAIVSFNIIAPSSAAFVQTDTTTLGSWQGIYGSDGYQINSLTANLPTYAQVAFSNALSYTWATSTTDVRAVQKPASTTDRIASTWYSYTNFSIDLNLMDGLTHQ